MSNSADKLIKYQKQGYLFHGSPNPELEELIPKQSLDTKEPDSWNTDKAVFATSEPAAAVIFSLIDTEKLKESGEWSVKWEGNKTITTLPKQWIETLKKQKGYVYVLEKESFKEKLYKQYKSKKGVTPIDKLAVTLNDYEYLGGNLREI